MSNINPPIGATCEVKYVGDYDPVSGSVWYVSFGKWEDDATHDSFGVNDELIAYYCEGGEEELKSLMKKDNGQDFWVVDYELEYKHDD